MSKPTDVRLCYGCGCSDSDACLIHGVPCTWATDQLCSGCAPIDEVTATPEGREWLLTVMEAVEEHGPFGYEQCLAELTAIRERAEERERDGHDD